MKKFGVGIMGVGWVAGAHASAMLKNPHLKNNSTCFKKKRIL